MRVLVLGGTHFIGRAMVLELLRVGHTVTILTRGESPDDLPREVKRLRGDRNAGPAGLSQLHGRNWDACVDVSGYTAVQVRASVEALRNSVGRYIFTSAVSVYGAPSTGPVDERSSTVEAAPEHVTEVAGEMYGRLKVTCERIVSQALGCRATILRPQVVVGPFDRTSRLTYWLSRAHQAGPMLAPGDGEDILQVVDVQDVASFARCTLERDLPGVFNLGGERVEWRRFIEILAPQSFVWVPTAVLQAANLGFTDLPLFRPRGTPRSGLMHVDCDRAMRAGFTITPLRASVERVRAWMDAANQTACGLDIAIERQLIARAGSA